MKRTDTSEKCISVEITQIINTQSENTQSVNTQIVSSFEVQKPDNKNTTLENVLKLDCNTHLKFCETMIVNCKYTNCVPFINQTAPLSLDFEADLPAHN